MIAQLLGGEVLLSELLSEGNYVRQADVFTSASASSDVNGSAFFNSSTAPTSWSLAQLNGGSLYRSLLSVSAGSSPSIAAANVNAGFVESFGSGDIVLAGGSDSNVMLLSPASAAISVVAGAYGQSPFFAQSPSSAELNGGSLCRSLLSASAGSSPSIVAYSVNSGFLESFGFGAIAFAGGSDSNVALLSSANAVLSVVSGAFKHSPFSASSPSSAEFGAGSYFLSDATAYAFSYTNLPSNGVKLGMLYADAQSSASYSGIGVLRYAPTPDVCRPLEVRYMYRPQEARVVQTVKQGWCGL